MFSRACHSIILAALVVFLLVWPKIQRVRSGEKVVMSTLLGSRYSATSMTSMESAQEEILCDHELASGSSKSSIVLRENDPIPPSVEKSAMELHSTLQRLMEGCGDGQPVSSQCWNLLCNEASKLKSSLDQVQTDWAAESPRNSGGSLHSQAQQRQMSKERFEL